MSLPPSSSRTPPSNNTRTLPQLTTATSSQSPSIQERILSAELTPTAEEPEEVTFKARGIFHLGTSKSDENNHNVSTSWWGENHNRDELVQRRQSIKNHTLPAEQEIAYQRTKLAVSKALGKTVDVALDIAREVVSVGADALEFAPIPGLAVCAQILTNIWNNVQDIETNKLSCLALTERCANIFFSIRAEIEIVDDGDDGLAESLREPVEKLTESFRRIEQFISKHVSRPFLKRYLKRDEDARIIMYLEASLTDTVSLFNVAIQLRMFKGIYELGHSRLPTSTAPAGPAAGTPLPLTAVEISPGPDSAETLLSAGGIFTPTATTQAESQGQISIAKPGQPLSSRDIVTAIAAVRGMEAAQNSMYDAAELYAAMRIALRSADDVKILELLQIDKSEIQEAIKTIQRALEDPKLTPRPKSATENATAFDFVFRTGTDTAATSSGINTVVSSVQTQPLSVDTKTPHASAWPALSDLIPLSGIPEDVVTPHFPPTTPADQEQDVAFHREFLETGLEALRRLSVAPTVRGRSIGVVARGGASASASKDAGGSGDVDLNASAIMAAGESLPPWTITKWEVDRGGAIGWGVFSNVYKGTWRGQSVAIKVLAKTTSRSLFKNEIAIWASLDHPNVLKLLGASSATSDPPWFFVSPYMKNGTVEKFLRNRGNGEGRSGRSQLVQSQNLMGLTGLTPPVMPTPLQMMMEIAVGMAYLHRKGVLHGDLKANNILIDDNFHCVISDFGQSKLRSEVYRLSHENPERGNFRWQAPEIMSGRSNLTAQADVYSFAIVCYEILSGGQVPWAMLDDEAVQRLVLVHDKRPAIPFTHETPLALVNLIDECWNKDPFVRPLFMQIAKRIGVLISSGASTRSSSARRISSSTSKSQSPHRKGRIQELVQGQSHHVSPDMAPTDVLHDAKWDFGAPLSLSTSRQSVLSEPAFRPLDDDGAVVEFGAPLTKTMSAISVQPPPYTSVSRDIRRPSCSDSDEMGKDKDKDKDERTTTRTMTTQTTLTRSSSMHSWFYSSSESEGELIWGRGTATIASPLGPPDPEIMERWDERRYRLLLQHDFHPTLILPLWTPSPVKLGDVGYLSKPSGKFISFFNCLHPFEAADKRVHGMASIHGHGNYRELSHTMNPHKRNFAQIGRDLVKGILSSTKGSKRSVSNRLRAGHRHAFLVAEHTTYRYMVDIEIAKAWFKANIKTVWKVFGKELGLHREDIVLIIGALEARDYALFVSHENPDGQVHFDVFAERKEGREWGAFRTDEHVSEEAEEAGLGPIGVKGGKDVGLSFVNSSKISRVASSHSSSGTSMDCVLLARLRFKPDEDDPTRL